MTTVKVVNVRVNLLGFYFHAYKISHSICLATNTNNPNNPLDAGILLAYIGRGKKLHQKDHIKIFMYNITNEKGYNLYRCSNKLTALRVGVGVS